VQRIEERHVQALFDPLKRGQVNSLDFHCISILDCIARNNTRSLLVPQVYAVASASVALQDLMNGTSAIAPVARRLSIILGLDRVPPRLHDCC